MNNSKEVSQLDVVTVLGARPQFIKAAPVSKALAQLGLREGLLHTGQHYDEKMDAIFFRELSIPFPVENLRVGSDSHGRQTAKMLIGVEDFLRKSNPALVLVYGDTNSTLAGALAAVKLGIPVAHIEAGLRSYNLAMPEEVNRRMTDHISRLLFCPSDHAAENLRTEGIVNDVFVTGDVMLDAVNAFREAAFLRTLPEGLARDGYYLLTIHRPSNVDDPDRLACILRMIETLDYPVLWPIHPRTLARLDVPKLPQNLIVSEPLGYLDLLNALGNSKALITDSGGMQKEAYWLQRKCITLRKETEWVETLEGGWNTLLPPGSEVEIAAILARTPDTWKPLYGKGNAAKDIAANLLRFLKT